MEFGTCTPALRTARGRSPATRDVDTSASRTLAVLLALLGVGSGLAGSALGVLILG